MELALAVVVIGVITYMTSKIPSATVKRIAEAIARAEGYYVEGSIPNVRNNPGDLRWGTTEITYFATPEDGWNALYQQVEKMLSGNSSLYRPDMTIEEIARIYAGPDPSDQENWKNNVSQALGVSPNTKLMEIV